MLWCLVGETSVVAELSLSFLVDKQACNSDKQELCLEQRRQLEQLRDLCAGENIQFAISTDLQFAEKQFNIYGALPRLCFFRETFPIIYDGASLNVTYSSTGLCLSLV